MNRARRFYELLKARGTLTMGYIVDYPTPGLPAYTARNAAAEAKVLAAADGKVISHSFGKSWRDNAYTLHDSSDLRTEKFFDKLEKARIRVNNRYKTTRSDPVFRIGMRVELSDEGKKRISGKGRRGEDRSKGTLIGFGRLDGETIRVVPDGTKSGMVYHRTFWKPLDIIRSDDEQGKEAGK